MMVMRCYIRPIIDISSSLLANTVALLLASFTKKESASRYYKNTVRVRTCTTTIAWF